MPLQRRDEFSQVAGGTTNSSSSKSSAFRKQNFMNATSGALSNLFEKYVDTESDNKRKAFLNNKKARLSKMGTIYISDKSLSAISTKRKSPTKIPTSDIEPL